MANEWIAELPRQRDQFRPMPNQHMPHDILLPVSEACHSVTIYANPLRSLALDT